MAKTVVFDPKADGLRGYESDEKVDSDSLRTMIRKAEPRINQLRKKGKLTHEEEAELSSHNQNVSALTSYETSPNRLFPDQAQRARDRAK